MTSPEVLWAGWRSAYVSSIVEPTGRAAGDRSPPACVFCSILASGAPDDETHIVWRGDGMLAILNAYPYSSGHVLVMPARHVGGLSELDAAETTGLWAAVTAAVGAIEAAFRPEGINVGANLGKAAGAGVPGHLHVHALPRWAGDTNFMTTIANTRVMPEPLDLTWAKLREHWRPG